MSGVRDQLALRAPHHGKHPVSGPAAGHRGLKTAAIPRPTPLARLNCAAADALGLFMPRENWNGIYRLRTSRSRSLRSAARQVSVTADESTRFDAVKNPNEPNSSMVVEIDPQIGADADQAQALAHQTRGATTR